MSQNSSLREHLDLGVLGGMGPQATQYFVEELLRSVETRWRPRADQDYPSLVVRFACYLPDRTAALETNLEPFARAFIQEIEALLELGCPQIVVPCITAHAVIRTRLRGWPVVDIPQVVAAHLRQAHPRARIGVLATRGAHLAGVLDQFTDNGQEVMTLPAVEEEELMGLIYHTAKAWPGRQDFARFADFPERLRRRGCDLVVAGCSEVEMCLARCAGQRTDLIFPLQIVAAEFANAWRPAAAPDHSTP